MKILSIKFFTSLICALFFYSAHTLANDTREREKLINEINTDIKALGNTLKNVPKDKDSRNIDKASTSLKEIVKQITELKPIANEDKQATLIVKDYPKAIQDFSISLADLKQAKIYQFKIDPLDDACKKTKEALDKKITELTEENTGNSAEKIQETAESVAKSIDEKLDDALKLYKKIDTITRDVKRFSYRKNVWNSTEAALDKAADGITQYMKTSLDHAEKICAPLAKAEKLSEVSNAITELDNLKANAKDFVERGEKWFKSTRDVFNIDCEAREEIRQAYCKGDYEPNQNPSLAAYDNIANKEASKVINELKLVIKDYAPLEREGNAILANGFDKDVDRLLTNMKKRKEGLAKLTKGEHLKGSRNPKVQTWVRYGVQMHKSLETKYNCDLNDAKIPGDKIRPDCISAKRCMVYEFKPNYLPAVKAGEGQVQNYAELVNDIAEAVIEELGDYDPSEVDEFFKDNLTGNNLYIYELWKNQCIDDEGISNIGFDVITYKKCGSEPVQCEQPSD